MQSPLPSPLGLKRPIDALMPSMDGSEETDPPALHDTKHEWQILKRFQHRRQNIATRTWGPEALPNTRRVGPASQDSGQPFNVYKAILRHPNLFFQFALRVPLQSIIDLYAIDKEFHYRLNKYSLGLIHDYAKYHAPLAAHIFSYNLYPELCISDPMLRPMDNRPWLARDVPGFRWISMVLWREKIVRSILTALSKEGHRVPYGCFEALMKYWVLMDLPTKGKREAFVCDKGIWSDKDIVNLQLLVLKLDMRFSDPVVGNGYCHLSRMLLMQRSLSTLWKVLTGRTILNYDEIYNILIRTYTLLDLDMGLYPWRDEHVNKIPRSEWCLMSREHWEANGKAMPSAVDLVIAQGIKRDLDVQEYLLDFVLYGFIDPRSGKSIPTPRQYRMDTKAVLPKEGWPGRRKRDRAHEAAKARLGRKPEMSHQEMVRQLMLLKGVTEEELTEENIDHVGATANGLDLMDIEEDQMYQPWNSTETMDTS